MRAAPERTCAGGRSWLSRLRVCGAPSLTAMTPDDGSAGTGDERLDELLADADAALQATLADADAGLAEVLSQPGPRTRDQLLRLGE